MSKCLPGMPCYDTIVYTTYPRGCTTSTPSPYTLPLSSENLYYAGPNLPYTGVETEDSITDALQKIDVKLSAASIFALLISAIDNDPDLKTQLCEKIGTCP